MFREHIEDDNIPIIFETSKQVLFSILKDSTFNKKWEPWKERQLELKDDSTLIYRKKKGSFILGRLDLKNTQISKMNLAAEVQSFADHSESSAFEKDVGIVVTCTMNGFPTSFRCILSEYELHNFFKAVQSHVVNPTVDSEALNLDTYNYKSPNKANTILPSTSIIWGAKSVLQSNNNDQQSYMRQSLMTAMDKYSRKSKQEQIMGRRGAMQCLPVLFDNDLIHGSWWFALGSLATIFFSSIVLANSYHTTVLGTDDSILSNTRYQAVWICIVISAIFYLFGSLAFVRAMFVTPPMRPIFSGCYHISSDELLGSWLFMWGTLPYIPYSIVYFVSEPIMAYAVLVILSLIVFFMTLIFVLSCYPGYKARRSYLKPVMRCLFYCIFSQPKLEKHFHNDWLCACWIIFWSTLVATLSCIFLSIQAGQENKPLLLFIYVTGFIEMLFFLFGSAYFVAGSYPPSALALDQTIVNSNNAERDRKDDGTEMVDVENVMHTYAKQTIVTSEESINKKDAITNENDSNNIPPQPLKVSTEDVSNPSHKSTFFSSSSSSSYYLWPQSQRGAIMTDNNEMKSDPVLSSISKTLVPHSPTNPKKDNSNIEQNRFTKNDSSEIMKHHLLSSSF